LTATLKDAAGTVLTGRTVTWSSSDVQVATVSSTGAVTALAPGSVTISVASEGRLSTATVVVLARLASTVTLTPNNQTVIVGSTLQLVSQITDPAGNLLTGRPIAFTSDAIPVAEVSEAGLVTAIAPGTAKITATSEGKVGIATILVTPVPVATVAITPLVANLFMGGTVQLSAQALGSDSAILAGRPVTWISGAPSIAVVSSAGVVTTVAPGTALILGVIDGVSASATITVRVPPVASVTVTPETPSIVVDGTSQLSAALRDSSGTLVSGRIVTWAATDESIAFVSSNGLVIGLKTGTTTILATSEGVIGVTVVTVR
jgi:uncharacterized protein YjdB